jgi:integrase/recombinase XerD
LKTIIIDLVTHRETEIVLIKFPRDNDLQIAVRQIKNVRWSQTLKGWYAPYSIEVLNDIKRIFDPIGKIDAALLKEKVKVVRKKKLENEYLKVNELKIQHFKHWLKSKRYSESTIATYSDALVTFLRFFHDKAIDDITNDDVILFNNEYILKNELSSSYQNQVVNAIKLFFRTIEKKSIEVDLIHRPKRQKRLPNVLSKEEIKEILDAAQNLKHKAMLSLIYACGLRCGEVLRLRQEHVDTKRMILLIKQGKGRKDRIAPLSVKIAELLRTYYKAFKPIIYLFEGATEGLPYDARSLQNVLKQNLARTQIKKPVSLHWLRHSYATHLLENGTDLRYIQEILGHSSSKTTEIYTHVSNKSIQKIVSPFDTL